MKKKSINYIALFLVGIVNGLFASGAGQILVFYYVYILKKDTKEARDNSLMIIPIISIITMFFYIKKANVEITKVLIISIIAIIFGNVGNVAMKKLNNNFLNIISGIFLIVFSTISLWRLFV